MILARLDGANRRIRSAKPATTLAGAAALLTFWIEDDLLEDGEMCWHRPALQNLAEALQQLAAT